MELKSCLMIVFEGCLCNSNLILVSTFGNRELKCEKLGEGTY